MIGGADLQYMIIKISLRKILAAVIIERRSLVPNSYVLYCRKYLSSLRSTTLASFARKDE